jgi:hypothetical protein
MECHSIQMDWPADGYDNCNRSKAGDAGKEPERVASLHSCIEVASDGSVPDVLISWSSGV